ncbi:MAG TPA: tetratricopeptide repeat protein [Candidatus Limnocylindria bacterium]|nr:tetratricopeptide repeat protein [Candidatus Limnocylindria bacterium]
MTTASDEDPLPQTVGPWAAQWHARSTRLREIEARLVDAPNDVTLLLLRARLLEELGLRDDARNAYLDVLVRDRFHYDAMMRLGTLFATSRQGEFAETVFAEAALRHPDQAPAHTALGNTLLDKGDKAGAQRAFEAALQIDSLHHEAHRGLAIMLERSGRPDEAEPHWRKGFPDGSIAVAPYRGATTPVRLLVLCSAIGGNIPLQHVLDDRIFATATLVAESYTPTMTFPPHEVAFNAVGDADRSGRALGIVEQIVPRLTVPLVNPPDRIATSGRVAVADRLRELPGVVTPRIVAFPRAQLTDGDVEATLAAHGFSWPVLLRSPGFHTGEHFTLVEEPATLAETVAELPGEELLVLSYLDTRGADGSFRKYRAMFIDGTAYPLHLAISPNWKVHYFSAAMADDQAFRDEEQAYLEDMEGVLGAPGIAALARIRETLALDYGGIDFALDARGRLAVFESNATMVILVPNADTRWDYRRKPIQRVLEATRAMLVGRAQAYRRETGA